MKSAGQILLDFLLHFIINGNFLSVYGSFTLLPSLSFSGNLCGNLNGFEIVFFSYAHSNDAFSDFTNFLSSCFGSNDFSMIQQIGYLISQQGPFSDRKFFLIFCTLPFFYLSFILGTSGHALRTYLPNVFYKRTAVRRQPPQPIMLQSISRYPCTLSAIVP